MKTNKLAKFTAVLMIVVAVAACSKKKNNQPAPAPAAANPYPYPTSPTGAYNANMPVTIEIYRNQVRCFNDRNVEVGCTGNIKQPNPGCIFEQLIYNGNGYNSMYCVQPMYFY